MRRWTTLIALFSLGAGYVGAAQAEYIFSAPPRETQKKGEYFYQPIAEFLTRATGEKFVYEYPVSWPTYAKKMKTNHYDLIFDGPHFVSWRIENIQHKALVKLPQQHVWTVIAGKDNVQVNKLDDLEARRFCGPASPNFGTLTFYTHFTNPVREPVHTITKGWRNGYDGVLDGKCQAAVLPKTNHEVFDPAKQFTKVIHVHEPFPNQGFTAGPGMSPELKQRVKAALLSPDGQQAMSRLRDRFTKGKELVAAEDSEFDGVNIVLDRAIGFGIYAY